MKMSQTIHATRIRNVLAQKEVFAKNIASAIAQSAAKSERVVCAN